MSVSRLPALLPLGALAAGFGAPLAHAEDAAPVMPKVTVEAAAPDEGYRATGTRIGKREQDPLEVAQSLTVVPHQLIDDRKADTLKEALRNVAGLTFNAGEGGRIGDNITLRGYSVVGDLYLDGLRDAAQYNRETFNLEQVEVLKGASSMLFGRGSTGGVINQVAKQPTWADAGEVALTGGSHGYGRLTADLDRVLTDQVAVRVNAMATDDHSFRDGARYRRWGLAGALSWTPSERDEVQVSAYHLADDNVPDFGVPYFGGRPIDVPADRFYGMSNVDHEYNDTTLLTASWARRFGTDGTWRTMVRSGDYARDLWATAPRLAGGTTTPSDATVINRQRQARGGVERTYQLQSDVSSRFSTGGLVHEWLAGIEATHERARRWNITNTVANPPTTLGAPDVTPVLPANFFDGVAKAPAVRYTGWSHALFAQDAVTFAPGWQVVLGARLDNLRADYERPAPQGDLARSDRVGSWRAGLVWQPQPDTSYYLMHGTAFNPSAELYQLDDRTANTPPEKNRNLELGAKWRLFGGGLDLAAALARTEKTNERNTDLALPDVALLSGRRHTDTLELQATGRPTERLEVFATFALLRARIDEASGQQAGTLGKVPLNTPRHTASLWATYAPDATWRFGAGLESVGARWANNTNTNRVEGYERVDLMVEWARVGYAVQLNVRNALGQNYYEGVYQGHAVPGTTRDLQLTLTRKF